MISFTRDDFYITLPENLEYVTGKYITPSQAGLKATNILYLDRDGVLNVDTGYPTSSSLEFDITCLNKLRSLISYYGFDSICVVSNQSGVARHYFTYSEAIDTMLNVITTCKSFGIHISSFFLSLTHPSVPNYLGLKKDSFYRKPNSGMLELSRRFYPNLSLSKSFLVGDKISDCMAGLNFGLPHANLLILRDKRLQNFISYGC